MKTASHYRPQSHDPATWESDFETLVALGCDAVHIGSNAWHSIEPREGQFELDWLLRCIDLASGKGLRIVLNTPTATPPVWLQLAHPEVLPVDHQGHRAAAGVHGVYSPVSPALMHAVGRVLNVLLERFANHPGIIGWQIDNTFHCNFIDQSDHSQNAFRAWLGQRYQTIDALNHAWGASACNTFHSDFSHIRLPSKKFGAGENPHHHLAARRYWSSARAAFIQNQIDQIRPAIGGRTLGCNFSGTHADLNPADIAPQLSQVSWDSYPCLDAPAGASDETFRLGDPSEIALLHGYFGSFNGNIALNTLQPGQAHCGAAPAHLFPGAVRLWLWTAYAHGAEIAAAAHLRQPLTGGELFHHGLVATDGATPTLGGRQFQQFADEVSRLVSLKPKPAPVEKTVGLVVDFDQQHWFSILPQSCRWNYRKLLTCWHHALSRLGMRIQILRHDQEWPADLTIIAVPGLQMVDEQVLNRMNQYVNTGGHLVLTCRTAMMNRDGHLFDGPIAKPILPLIGGTIDAYDGLPADLMTQVELDGKKYSWGVWGDLIYNEPDTKVLAKYAGQFYAGAAAVIQKRHEKGIVTYCGIVADQDFTDALVLRLAGQSGLNVTQLPARVHLIRRNGYDILMNHTTGTVEAPAPARTRFVVGGKKVEPAGVAVWPAA